MRSQIPIPSNWLRNEMLNFTTNIIATASLLLSQEILFPRKFIQRSNTNEANSVNTATLKQAS